MFGKQAYELLQEVANVPADNLPPFNVSGGTTGAPSGRRRVGRPRSQKPAPGHSPPLYLAAHRPLSFEHRRRHSAAR